MASWNRKAEITDSKRRKSKKGTPTCRDTGNGFGKKRDMNKVRHINASKKGH